MLVDTSKTITIDGSPWKMLGLALMSLLFVLVSAAIVTGNLGGLDAGDYRYWVAWLGVLFFGFTTVMIAWRALMERGAVVMLTPTGITDKRVATAEIPWAAIGGISTWSHQGQKVMVLRVDPKVEAGLPLSRIARYSRQANKSLGADGLCITASGLKIRYDDLLAAATRYAEAVHGPARS